MLTCISFLSSLTLLYTSWLLFWFFFFTKLCLCDLHTLSHCYWEREREREIEEKRERETRREGLNVRGMDTINKHKSPFQRWPSMCICLLVSPQQYTVQTNWAASWVASTHQWSREEDSLYGSGNTIHQLPLSKPWSDCPAAQQNQANKPQCTK